MVRKTPMSRHQNIGSKAQLVLQVTGQLFTLFVSGVWSLLEYCRVILSLFPQTRLTEQSVERL